MVVLQHAPVVVSEGERALRGHVEVVILPVVAHVVDYCAEDRHEEVHGVVKRTDAHLEEGVHGLRDVRGVYPVVERHVGIALISLLRLLQKRRDALPPQRELAEDATAAKSLPSGEKQRPLVGQFVEAEHVEVPVVELLVEQRAQPRGACDAALGHRPDGQRGAHPWQALGADHRDRVGARRTCRRGADRPEHPAQLVVLPPQRDLLAGAHHPRC
mmetsp:Transcript_86228/g.263957  ORF Transcript_86228/g.263957 Transcript_86228/m.263957 type:complete len:215 (+) Transcript_86228:647-1291(+)